MNIDLLTVIHSFAPVIFMLCIINYMIPFPIIFHLFIIPKIQKRIGMKIEYKLSIYNWQVFSKWFVPPFDIAITIVNQYLSLKIKGEIKKIWRNNPNNRFALASSNYDIRDAPWFEVLMSFLIVINMLLFGLIIILHFIIPSII